MEAVILGCISPVGLQCVVPVPGRRDTRSLSTTQNILGVESFHDQRSLSSSQDDLEAPNFEGISTTPPPPKHGSTKALITTAGSQRLLYQWLV